MRNKSIFLIATLLAVFFTACNSTKTTVTYKGKKEKIPTHNYRVTLYAMLFAERLGIELEQMRNLISGAFLHDVGKIGIRDNVLGKPGRLTDEERLEMQQHVVLGIDIVSSAEWLGHAREVIESHHEKYDGSGYCQGLKGEEIPMTARIFAIVDVFDALTTERPYKKAFGIGEALDIMKQDRGTHFDPALLDVFFEMAAGLHKRVGAVEYETLRQMLAQAIERYFFKLG